MRVNRQAALLVLAASVSSLGGCRAPVDHGVGDAGVSNDGGDGGEPADASVTGPIDFGPGPGIAKGAPDRILLLGTILTPDQVIVGQVLVEGTTITCVADGDGCAAMPGASGATIIDTKGIISPGLIDTHNHILFDIFDETDWKPIALYQDHTQWTAEPRYSAMLDVKQCIANDSQGKPSWCANTPYGTPAGSLRCEMDKFGELKGLVAGTTSIVGLPGTSAACFSSLARSIDVSQNGLGTDKVQTSAIFPPSKTSVDGACANFASGTTNAYLIHNGEGTNAKALGEFTTLSNLGTQMGCLLAPQTTITHGTAFGIAEWTTMQQKGVKLTWSPASNVALYGQTADIPTALTTGVTVALAPDWSMGGSQNLLDEMRFADAWDNAHWSDQLTSKQILGMTTQSAAKVVAFDDRLGRVAVGYLADLAVFAGDTTQPYDAILRATPKEVVLTMVGGTVLYGAAALVAAGPESPGCEMIDICGVPKFLCAATSATTNKLDQTYAQIKSALEQAMLDVDAQTPSDGWSFAPLAPLVKCP